MTVKLICNFYDIDVISKLHKILCIKVSSFVVVQFSECGREDFMSCARINFNKLEKSYIGAAVAQEVGRIILKFYFLYEVNAIISLSLSNIVYMFLTVSILHHTVNKTPNMRWKDFLFLFSCSFRHVSCQCLTNIPTFHLTSNMFRRLPIEQS